MNGAESSPHNKENKSPASSASPDKAKSSSPQKQNGSSSTPKASSPVTANGTNDSKSTDKVNGSDPPVAVPSSGNSGIQISSKTFWNRIIQIYDNWRAGGKQWKSADAPVQSMMFISEQQQGDENYSRLSALQLYLFGYEVPDSLFWFCFKLKKIIILTSAKKAKILQPITESDKNIDKKEIEIEILESNKTDKNEGNFKKIFAQFKLSQVDKEKIKIGHILNKRISTDDLAGVKGLYGEVWNRIFSDAAAAYEPFDLTQCLGSILSVKDSQGRISTEKAADLSSRVLKKYLLPEIESIIDEEKVISQLKLADQTDDVIRAPDQVGSQLKPEDVETCYSTIIQSGTNNEAFDLKISANTSEANLNYDSCTTIICQLGARYKNFCSNIGRTYFINPKDEQREIYLILSQIYINIKQTLKAGNRFNQVYLGAQRVIQQSKKPELVSNFTKNCGFIMGLEFRDANYILNEKNAKIIQKNMIFNISIGFQDLKVKVKKQNVTEGEDEFATKNYAMLIADTMIVTDDEPESLTKMPREYTDVAYSIGDEVADNNEMVDIPADTENVRNTRTREKQTSQLDEAAETARALHQQELAKKQREDALRKLAKNKGEKDFDGKLTGLESDFNCYKSFAEFPREAKRDRIFVDIRKETVLLPIHDQLVPFHISRIKNVNKQEEGNTTYLRINFVVPDVKSLEKITDSNIKFVSELTYRTNSTSLSHVFFEIKELKKKYNNKLKEYEAKSNIVIQEDLKLEKRGPVPTLKDVMSKPKISSKQRTFGTLQAHVNGFRYITTDRLKIDIIYANIKAAFYQPAEDSHQVLLHFQLYNPILVSAVRKVQKTDYIQFFVEVIESSEDLNTTNRWRDEDGLLEEQEDRRRRKRWNERFLNFVKEVEELLKNTEKLEFDIPYKELAFTGVPGKSSVQIMPSVHSLVALDDTPPLVASLSDIEIAVFERVQFGLRNFDLVFVWKDLNKDVLRIDSIPTKFLDQVKTWLDQCDIIFYETPSNIIWKAVMKTIKDDVVAFWQDGGWSVFLGDGPEGEQGEDGEDVEMVESASEFEPSSAEESSAVDSEEYETPSSEDDYSGDDDSDAMDDDETSGEDWDELELKAKRADQEKTQVRKRDEGDIDSDEEQRKKKRPKARG